MSYYLTIANVILDKKKWTFKNAVLRFRFFFLNNKTTKSKHFQWVYVCEFCCGLNISTNITIQNIEFVLLLNPHWWVKTKQKLKKKNICNKLWQRCQGDNKPHPPFGWTLTHLLVDTSLYGWHMSPGKVNKCQYHFLNCNCHSEEPFLPLFNRNRANGYNAGECHQQELYGFTDLPALRLWRAEYDPHDLARYCHHVFR